MDKIVNLIGLALGALVFLWHPFLLVGILLGVTGTYLWIKYPQKIKSFARSGMQWIR